MDVWHEKKCKVKDTRFWTQAIGGMELLLTKMRKAIGTTDTGV